MTDVTTAPIRRCRQCGQLREAASFASATPQARCVPCRSKQRDQNRAARLRGGSEAIRDMNLWSKYRIRSTDYDALRTDQGHRCAICRTHEDDLSAKRVGRRRVDGQPAVEAFRLVVDHCHDTGRVRGLLCNDCNSALGYLKDNPALFLAAITYLSQSAGPLLRDN